MSRHDYRVSLELVRSGVPYCALLLAALARADSTNYQRLAAAFPDVAQELAERAAAPGNMLSSEQQSAGQRARAPK